MPDCTTKYTVAEAFSYFLNFFVYQKTSCQVKYISANDPKGMSVACRAVHYNLFHIDAKEISFTDPEGNISSDLKKVIDDGLDSDVGLIHLGVSDYLMKKTVGYIEASGKRKADLSCINNTHMCCGEGICGACTRNTDARKIVHLCKEQMDVYEYSKILV